jgi:hypothetical protein
MPSLHTIRPGDDPVHPRAQAPEEAHAQPPSVISSGYVIIGTQAATQKE